MFKKLVATVSVVALLGAATPAFAHDHGWHRGPGFGPLVALGAVAGVALGVAALTAPHPAVVYAPPPAYYPPPPAYYGAPY